MPVSFTPEQQAAISARNTNILLSAAAGSGKTATLVRRVEELIDEGADISRMLVVTFTKAAAADMRDSLISALEKRAKDDARFRRQVQAAHFAPISTIHSFCRQALREQFQKADIDPSFRICDEQEADELLTKALDNVIDAMSRIRYMPLVCGNETLPGGYTVEPRLLDALCEYRNVDSIRESCETLYKFLMNRPDPFAWAENSVAEMRSGEDHWSSVIADEAKLKLRDAAGLCEHYGQLLSEAGYTALYAAAVSDMEFIESLLPCGYAEMKQRIAENTYARFSTPKGHADDPAVIQAKDEREKMKKLITDVKKKLEPDLERMLADLPAVADEAEALVILTKSLDDEYTRLKRQKNLLSFTDLEHKTLELLKDDAVADALRNRYTHIFVDEYQDVSDVQEAIISRIARSDNVFRVGDVKQSIYSFRNAEPSLFRHIYERYEQKDGGTLMCLTKNFRSRANVLEYTNAVFEKAMHGGETEIVYDANARLYPAAAYEGEDPETELYLIGSEDTDQGEVGEEIPEPDDSEKKTDIEEISAADLKDAEYETCVAADRITELLGTDYYDAKKKEHRPLRYSDFVILTRKARDVAQRVLAVLKAKNIPAYADISGGYTEVTEVRIALALMSLAVNRRSDTDWIAVLRSPVVLCSSEELAAIRALSPEGSYFAAVEHYIASSDNLTARKLKELYAMILRWHEEQKQLPLAQFVYRMLVESGLYGIAGALPGGKQRKANLDMLCDKAADYEAGRTGGLTGFIDSIKQQAATASDMGEAHIIGENDDVVRIMTVHKSKGLEFPVVIGINLGKGLLRSDSGNLLLHRKSGIGLMHIDNDLGTLRETLPHMAAGSLKKCEALAEEMRILYVLLTRAKDRLILIAGCKNTEATLAAARLKRTPSSYLDMLLPPFLEPHPELKLKLTCIDRSELDMHLQTSALSVADIFDTAGQQEPPESLISAYAYRYAYADAVLLPLKLNASGLNREIIGPSNPPQLIQRPLFLQEDAARLTAAERGTAMHAALQGLALDRLKEPDDDALHSEIVRQLNTMTERNLLTQAMREVVRPIAILNFLRRDIGKGLLASENVKREWKFTLRMGLSEAMGIDSEEEVLIQGSVDCCYLDNGAWVLLDYKTDRTDDEDELLKRHGAQLNLYRKALERITGIPVKKTVLCLLNQSKELAVQNE